VRDLGRVGVAAVALVIGGGLASACSQPKRSEDAAVTAASSQGVLYSIEPMRQARLHREVGARRLEKAYAMQESLGREAELRAAFEQFSQAQTAYHRALAEAPARYQPVIQGEIDQVAEYMRQIQVDYPGPLLN
jgi:hypothetical protein